MHRDSIQLTQFVQHTSGGQCLDDGSTLSPDLKQIIGEQGINAQLIDEISILIADPAPVSITIRDQQNVRMVLDRCF